MDYWVSCGKLKTNWIFGAPSEIMGKMGKLDRMGERVLCVLLLLLPVTWLGERAVFAIKE
jgi:hypothetical protein